LVAVLTAGLIFAGYKPTTEHSNSMAPYLHRGDLIFNRSITASQAHVGQVITFDDPYFKGVRLTHRVRSVKPLTDGRIAFVTRGDAVKGTERWTIAAAGQLTAVAFRIPGAGKLTLLLDAHPILLALALALALWILVLQFVWGSGSGGGDDTRPRKKARGPGLKSKARRYLLLGFGVLLVLAPAAAAMEGVFRSAASSAPPAVSLRVNDGGQPLFQISSMRPGESFTACEQVTSAGPSEADVGIYASASGSGLQNYLGLSLIRGSLPAESSPGSCSGFTPDTTDFVGAGPGVLYAGAMSGFPSSPATAIADPVADWPSGSSVGYQMTVTLADENSAQGLTAEQRFYFGANPATKETGGGGSGNSGGKSATVPPSTTPPTTVPAGPRQTPQRPRTALEAEAELLLACGTSKLALSNLLIVGSRVSISGVTAPGFAHQKAQILLQGSKKPLATVTVGANGTFTASVPLPSRPLLAGAHYLVRIGKLSSVVLSLSRRLTLNAPTYSSGSVTISGHVVAPLSKPPSPVIVQQRILCGRLVTLAKIKPSANGHYSATIAVPNGQAPSVFSATTYVLSSPGSHSTIGTRSLNEVVAVP
jgi:signal peptidase I